MKRTAALVLISSLVFLIYLESEPITRFFKSFTEANQGASITDFEKKVEKPAVRPTKSLKFPKEYLIAKRIPTTETRTIAKLANYINQKTTTELEKARVIYAWIALNIQYDDDKYNYGGPNISGTEVLKVRKAVCGGYSNLFNTLCTATGLKAVTISGYSKGSNFAPENLLKSPNHAWNAVKVNGKWQLVDVTWGAGFGKTVKGKLQSTQEFDDYWFATSPYEFVFKHLPQNPKHQLLTQPLSKKQFAQLDKISSGLFQLGFPGEKTFSRLIASNQKSAPKAYRPQIDMQVKAAPLNGKIITSKPFKVRVYCPEDVSMAIINEGKWTYLKKKDNYYYGAVLPQSGILKVGYQLKGFDDSYHIILEYQVLEAL